MCDQILMIGHRSANIYRVPEFKPLGLNDIRTTWKMPANNKSKGFLSPAASKRLNRYINLLVESLEFKYFDNPDRERLVRENLSFITLTLPAFQIHSDRFIKRVLLNRFLTDMSRQHGMTNYIWRAEAQENGNIHFHILTDIKVHWRHVRTVWNKCLAQHEYIDLYKRKFSQMTFEQYKEHRMKHGTTDMEQIGKAFLYGCDTNWRDPNTTDIHSLEKVGNIAAYMGKYMSKKGHNLPVHGKLYGRSESIHSLKACKVEIDPKVNQFLTYFVDKLKPETFYHDFGQVVKMDLRPIIKANWTWLWNEYSETMRKNLASLERVGARELGAHAVPLALPLPVSQPHGMQGFSLREDPGIPPPQLSSSISGQLFYFPCLSLN